MSGARQEIPGRFKPGKSGNPARQFKPGQSGCPGGVSVEKRTFREIMDELGSTPAGSDQKSRRAEAAEVFWRAVRLGQPWALREFLAREWPATLQLAGVLGVAVQQTEDGLEQLEAALARRSAARHVNGGAGSVLRNGHAVDEGEPR